MASFGIDKSLANMIKEIESFASKDEIYSDMISAGQDIMKSEIEKGASRHVVTGKMAKSLKCTKPVLNKDGIWVGRVKFYGSDGVYTTKAGKKYDITNWLKAFRIEYGTSTQKAEPFVRPAIQKSEPAINSRWQAMFNEELKKLK